MKRTLSAALIAATMGVPAFAAGADKVNNLCESMAEMAATAATARASGVPKEGFDRKTRPTMEKVFTPEQRGAVQATIDATYRMEWSPSEARRNIWTMCLKNFDGQVK